MEAREQVEHKLGQTLSLDQHWLRFSRYLELMPQGRNADGDLVANVTQPHAINHWLNSCSPALPAELEAAGYKPPRWHGKKEHTTSRGFASVRACYDWMLNEEKPLRAESRDLGLKQHWVDFPGRSAAGMTKAQQKKLVGSVAVDESLLTPASVRALMAQCADSAVAKSEVRLEQRFEDRLTGVEASMGSLESTVTSQLKAVAQELKSEIQQSRFKGKGGGDRKGKGGWNRPRWQQPQQQQQGWQQQQSSPWSQPANASAAQSAPPMGPAGKWGSGRKPIDCWNCGGNHFARDCRQQTDASNAQVRRGANAVSMSLAGGGSVTSDELEEQFGSVDEARSWVAAVYDATENWMAAVQWNQGAEGSTQLHDATVDCSLPDCTHNTPTALHSGTSLSKLDTSKLFGWHSAHTPHSTLYWNRLYHSKTDWLRPCRLIETLTDGTVRLEFRCDRREGNEQGQLKPADRLRQYLHECSDVHVDALTHAQRLLLCENMQLKTGATGMATDSSVLPGPTTVNARAVLNRGHRESAAVSNLNAACISAECSRLHAGAVVNAPLNASSALSLHVSPSESEQVPSVPTVSCGLEYPPCQSSDVLRGDLSPLNTCDCDGVPPIGVPPVSHHSSAFSESWGKILGLVAAPLVGNAATVPPLQKRAVQCNAVSQSGSQSDTQLRVTDSQMILAPRLRDSTGLRSRDGGLSDGHTQLSATDGSCEPLDCQSPCELTKSKFGSSSSCGCAHAPIAPTALSPHPNAEPLDNRCTEREKGSDSQLHACEELPEIIAAIESDRSRLDSVDTVPRLVDDDTSSGEESESKMRTDRQTAL